MFVKLTGSLYLALRYSHSYLSQVQTSVSSALERILQVNLHSPVASSAEFILFAAWTGLFRSRMPTDGYKKPCKRKFFENHRDKASHAPVHPFQPDRRPRRRIISLFRARLRLQDGSARVIFLFREHGAVPAARTDTCADTRSRARPRTCSVGRDKGGKVC